MASTRKIILTAVSFDALGYLEMESDAIDEGLRDRTRRVSKRRTLDGSVVLDDRGITPGDRNIVFSARLPLAEIETLNHLFDNHALLHAATEEGMFEVAPSTMTLDGNLVSGRLLIKSQVA
jgi:hypothetical protein